MKQFQIQELEIPEELQTFIDSPVGELIKEEGGIWLAGGSLRRVFSGEPYYLIEHDYEADFDTFFHSQAMFRRCFLRCKNAGYKVVGDHKYVLTLASPQGQRTQLMRRNWLTAEDHIARFDMTVCQLFFDGHSIFAPEETIEDIYDRILRPVFIDNVHSTLRHIMKYAIYGYDLSDQMSDAIVEAIKQGASNRANTIES